MSFWRRSLGRAAIMVAQAVITRGLGIISSGLLARLLSPKDWGSLQAIIQMSGTMTQTLKLTIDGGLQIRLSETAREPDAPTEGEFLGAALLILGLLALLAILLGMFLSVPSAKLFGEKALAPFMDWAGWLAAGQLISQIAAVLLAFGAFRTLATIHVTVNCLYLSVLAAAYVLHMKGLGVGLFAQLCLQLCTGVAFVVFAARAWRARGIRPTLSRLRLAQRELLRLGLPLHAAAAVPTILSLLVSANLARTDGLSALAELRVVAALNQLVLFIPGAFATTFVTQFAGARGSASEVSSYDFLRYIRLIVASATTTATATAWLAVWLVPLIFGSTYASAAKLAALGVATAVVSATKQALVVGLVSERKTGYALTDSLLSSIGYTILAVWLTPSLGVLGLLLAELLGQLSTLIILGGLLSSRFVQNITRRQAVLTVVMLALTLCNLVVGFVTYDEAFGITLRTLLLVCVLFASPALLLTAQERTWIIQTLRASWKR